MPVSRGFGSDNHAGVVPEVMLSVMAANTGRAAAYGDDEWTARAKELLTGHFGTCEIDFVFNGTGANCVCLSVMCQPWHSVICAQTAHINTDECGAPELIAGVKLVPVATPDGKLTPELIAPELVGFGFEHHAQPRVISISNASELGTVYTPAEIRALADVAHEHGMLLHIDGARLANAAASLGCSLREITVDAGVDALSFGATKNGALAAEAVVLFERAATPDVKYVRKQSAQLASKMRFISAQFIAMFEDDLWLKCATHANNAAARLADGARSAGVEIAYPVDANEVFARLDAQKARALAEQFRFYIWDETPDEQGRLLVRWVTAWDTSDEDVDALVSAVSG
jgi:threonine aldolase